MDRIAGLIACSKFKRLRNNYKLPRIKARSSDLPGSAGLLDALDASK